VFSCPLEGFSIAITNPIFMARIFSEDARQPGKSFKRKFEDLLNSEDESREVSTLGEKLKLLAVCDQPCEKTINFAK